MKDSHTLPSDPIAEELYVEVEEETERNTAEFEVSEELRFMNWFDRLDRLEFEYDFVFHDDIDAVATVDSATPIDNRQFPLFLKRQPLLFQFQTETFLICRFQ